MPFDVFLSYAHEDQAQVGLPLAKELENRGVSVWIDNSLMNVGDDVGDRIEKALADSDFGVVVLSRHYFMKSWTRRELSMLLAREAAGTMVLPVWHGISRDEVKTENSALADRVAASTESGIPAVAEQIHWAISRFHRYGNEPGNPTNSLAGNNFRRHAPRRLSPGGVLPLNATYVERTADDELWASVQKPAGLATLTAPRAMGKSSLLVRLAAKPNLKRKTVWVDLMTIGSYSANNCLHAVATSIAGQIGKLPPDDSCFREITGAKAAFQDFIGKVANETLVLLDEGDVLPGSDLEDFLDGLAMATVKQSKARRPSLYFMFASTAQDVPRILAARYPELGYHARLALFTPRETEHLFQLAETKVTDSQLDEVIQWTGGQPYLVQWSGGMLERDEPLAECYLREIQQRNFHPLGNWFSRLRKEETTALHRLLTGRRLDSTVAARLIENNIIVKKASQYDFAGRLFREYFSLHFQRPSGWLTKVLR